MKKTDFQKHIETFDFTNLFNQLGWDFADTNTHVSNNGTSYQFQTVAEKRGFAVMVCTTDALPDYATRLKLDREIAKRYREHLLIFCDTAKTVQLWQIVVRQQGKPSRLSETRWNKGQEAELLYQKTSNLFFTLDQEDNITIADVVDAVNQNFSKNIEKVTKAFYENFRKEHDKFLKFITGISEITDSKWYASLMLNRLMFCYFIQKKGFLDNNLNYLKEKLMECRVLKGENKFYGSFYRNFLLALFHQGLGSPKHADVKQLIGIIPYLNGGLFDVHELEHKYTDIDIEDNAFETIFNFFDEWSWHLDTRVSSSGKDINPDVIGYIFEKYINDRAQMGAYYTKEDITDYIGKNCIIPFLFDQLIIQNSKFKIDDLVIKSGDDYIYEAVKKGVDLPLPQEIEIGIDVSKPNLLERRAAWNKPATEEYALPTEIWREVVERRKRYAEVKAKIENGEIATINDFITYNLDIRQFAQDVVDTHPDPKFIQHFYEALSSVTIIDPTCGSGAFLFAAMNILEPLYESCLQRMENFVAEAKTGTYRKFEEILNYVNNKQHPNRKYFIFKNIILQNLYGVDIMKEAVEIAKLRLFLKLVATVEADYRKPNLGLEPLPDIDFNIRAGNTLIGFATENELEKAFQGSLDFDNDAEKTKEKCEIVARAFTRYKEIQLTHGDNYHDFKTAKDELNNRLKTLNNELNQLLHKQASGIPYDTWLQTHQPFHWFAEFYEIIKDKGGFDVIIGNPPYVGKRKYSTIGYNIQIANYQSDDLYGYVIKRVTDILNDNSRFGFIVMHNLAFSNGFKDVRNIIKKNTGTGWFSFYGRIPAGLFSGDVRVRNCIFLLDNKKSKEKYFYTTRLHRWFSDARTQLLPKLNYTLFSFSDNVPMYNSDILRCFFEKSKGKTLANYLARHTPHKLFFKQSAYNWIAANTEPAPCYDKSGKVIPQSQVSDFSIVDRFYLLCSLLLLNGKTFFSQWLSFGDEFHVTKDDLIKVKVPYKLLSKEDKDTLLKLANEFLRRIDNTIQYKLNAGKNVGTYNTSKLWDITDKSDKIFLKYLCDNPGEVFEAIEQHISQTVITVADNEEEE